MVCADLPYKAHSKPVFKMEKAALDGLNDDEKDEGDS